MNAAIWILPLVPLLGSGVTFLTRNRSAALGSALLTLAAGIVAVTGDKHVDVMWIRDFGVHFALGLDGMGRLMVLLTVSLVPIVLVAARKHPPMWMAWALILQATALGVFLAEDLFTFYIFFEATLIPAYFLIGLVGGPDRGRSAMKFLMYQVGGGLVLLGGLVGYYAAGAHSYLLSDLHQVHLSTTAERWLFVSFFIAFAAKAPLVPLHTWLADTTEQATPATSILLVCILDKIGTFAMIRYCLGLFPDASRWATPVVLAIALISVVYGAVLALAQTNVLRLIGLTSLSHFGLITVGVFVGTATGLQGSISYMVNHGIVTGALLAAAAMVIARTGTPELRAYAGLEGRAPRLAAAFLITALATAGLPGLSQFVSEVLVLIAGFAYSPWVGAIAVTSIVLAAAYALWTYQRIFTGPATTREGVVDLTASEGLVLVPLLSAMVVFGFWPQPILDAAHAAVGVLR
ncbi:NADH-quinone oxidoreductase, M subunit NuoM [Nocardioides baekrokdamisoli]|uniref:NADH-quinone oxidoreductase, M subunit NuoM n=1 Tax=Nocardioides baekrokdamisoli TaxID=1804624 RepID=A0A3G9IZN4_9ACTN|nr:NADH-quinone oxidoreductase subunit M [Nocardioides baekrokdamisoli]BBH17863.1 NADH-quinone oxidoreductase, M subunit NuoM [Nocardioides baekrokdamisoli]